MTCRNSDLDKEIMSPLPRKGPYPLSAYVLWAMRDARDDALYEAMIRGVRKYHHHDFVRPAPPASCVWQAGQARLLHYPAVAAADGVKKERGLPLFIVPSMVNSAAILDMLPDHSFVRFWTARGHDVFLLEWGDSVLDEGQVDFDTLIECRLRAAVACAANFSGDRLCVAGYCMGGTILAAAYARLAPYVQALLFLAAPWDFYAAGSDLPRYVREGSGAALMMIEGCGRLSPQWYQAIFARLAAGDVAQKFAAFAALDPETDREKEALFVAVEDWLASGAALPAAIARVCVRDWYEKNYPARGMWRVGGEIVDPGQVTVPCLVVAPQRDKLVAPDSAAALAKKIPEARLFQPDCGHIGMMVGRQAQDRVWDPLYDWLQVIKSSIK